MNPFHSYIQSETRRHFLTRGRNAVGLAALASLLQQDCVALGADVKDAKPQPAAPGAHIRPGAIAPHLPPKAKRVIYMHMVGGPAQMDLFDYKPQMKEWYNKDLPPTVRGNQRLTTMTSGQARFPIAPSMFQFQQFGNCGMWMNTMLSNLGKVADDMCFVRSMHTEAINHEPAVSLLQTGRQITGWPCLGSWVSYGLGSLNTNLPTFVVLVATPSNREQEQAISARLWSNGYLPGEHAGVSFRGKGDPILYINNPPGVSPEVRRKTLDGLRDLNQIKHSELGDPEIETRISNYEMAFRMQSSVPELTDIASEPASTYELYGEDAKKPGSFANTLLLSRRLVERGVRFVQIYHNNWDHHGNVAGRMPSQTKDIDRPCYGLITDLKNRGMLDDTLIIWGGEFGRTIYSQGGLSEKNYGRDHHPRCFTMWMAGGGARPGTVYGEIGRAHV